MNDSFKCVLLQHVAMIDSQIHREKLAFDLPCSRFLDSAVSSSRQFFEHVEEAVWAVEVLKTSGKPVGATLCISPHGDRSGLPPGECAVRLVKAGTLVLMHCCNVSS